MRKLPIGRRVVKQLWVNAGHTMKGGSGTGSGRRSADHGVNERSMFHKWSLTSGWMRGKQPAKTGDEDLREGGGERTG